MPASNPPSAAPAAKPLADAELARLADLLAGFAEPLQPLDPTSLDGYLCGVLLQPQSVTEVRWLPLVIDIEGRPCADHERVAAVAALARRRHAELDQAIARRRWFDPWVYPSDDEASDPRQAMQPWVAGFAAAMDRFPALLQAGSAHSIEPLALLYAAFDPEDLEDIEDLAPSIEELEPPKTMEEAVEDIVRAVLLLADVTRPLPAPSNAPRRTRLRPT